MSIFNITGKFCGAQVCNVRYIKDGSYFIFKKIAIEIRRRVNLAIAHTSLNFLLHIDKCRV